MLPEESKNGVQPVTGSCNDPADVGPHPELRILLNMHGSTATVRAYNIPERYIL
jgi:hypothetical protein